LKKQNKTFFHIFEIKIISKFEQNQDNSESIVAQPVNGDKTSSATESINAQPVTGDKASSSTSPNNKSQTQVNTASTTGRQKVQSHLHIYFMQLNSFISIYFFCKTTII